MSDEYFCRNEGCPKTFKTRSGRFKHEKKCSYAPTDDVVVSETVDESEDIMVEETTVVSPSSDDDFGEQPTSTTSSSKWQSFDMGFDDTVTETMPQPLKMLTKPPPAKKKMTKAEAKAEEDLNMSLLVGGLSIADSLMSKYGKATLLNDDFEVKHSDADKRMVAGAQWRYLKSKGVVPSAVVNEGLIAAGMTAWYLSPVVKITRKSKVPMLKGRLRFLQRLPLIGRFLGRRKRNPKITDFAQEVEDNE